MEAKQSENKQPLAMEAQYKKNQKNKQLARRHSTLWLDGWLAGCMARWLVG